MNTGDELGPPSGRASSRRKQNLAALLDALQELQQDGQRDEENEVSPQELERELARPATISDEKLGAEAFDKLDAKIKGLVRDLRRLANVSRDLASSVGIVKSTNNFENRLITIRGLLRMNAADLFPHKVRRTSSFINGEVPQKDDLEELPELLGSLVLDVDFFMRNLEDFSEITDEALKDSISTFKNEVKYLSSYMKDYQGQFKDNAIKKFIHDVTEQHLGEPIEDVAISLSTFIETGIRAIRSAQTQAATNFLTLSTVGTFFSAVTATTLQFSFADASTTLQITVNSFWFCSLVFSIASVVNSLLAYMWEHALYRSPGRYAPWWVTNWIKRSPLVFLIISAAAFSVGLCLFAYSSNQNIITSTLTTVFTSISSIGLVSVTLWFGCEKWAYVHHKGEKWLLQIIDEVVARSPGLLWISQRLSSHIFQALTSRKKKQVPVQVPAQTNGMDPFSDLKSQDAIVSGGGSKSKPDEKENRATVIDMQPSRGSSLLPQGFKSTLPPLNSSSNGGTRKSPSHRFQEAGHVTNAVRRLMRMNQQVVKKRMDRVGRSLLMLKSMNPTTTLTTHDALVRHMQFSPDGYHLATCSWDKKAAIYHVNDFNMPPIILDHNEELLSQLAWSPAGDLLLCKMLRGVTVWSSEGEKRKVIDRGRAIESVSWMPHGEAFLSVEGADVRKLDLEGNVLDDYPFARVTIHDVAVTKDSTRMICVASSTPQPDPDSPEVVVDRKEEMILVYNLISKTTESRVPVLGKSRNVKLSKDGQTALVSYENKAPPQRWKIGYRKTKAEDGSIIGTTACLTLEQTFMPKRPVDFAGPSHFGGRDDELVVSAGKNGTIYVWDSKTGFLLHQFSTRDIEGELTCIAWNHASDKFMFGAGRHDGTVRVWTPTSRSNIPPGSSIDTPRSSSPLPTSLRGRRGSRSGQGLGASYAFDRDHSREATTIEEETERYDHRDSMHPDVYLALSG
ncbi:WD40 repeat-like protein [Schizopora paradoxa]|uniref:WD40 repeat-like protein n=1 Tax=Schizopora paradoxa TaxID=27342 RepID=A0A0H2S565_9AGAM|nr:WD40 repeat-like protein [Schizopora paradoxa]